MLQGNKSTGELRFELLIVGTVLVVAAILYVILPEDLRSLMLFLPGLILLGAAIYQDMQPDWRAGWLTYALAVLMVATGLAGIVNALLGNAVRLNWVVVAVVELGAILIAKALYDPSPRT
ncbi:MAG: hypothetical protein JXB30_00820 [Anaerolineae bacterium]|nr:hypothetical protein [Anaerolineae bacterium]